MFVRDSCVVVAGPRPEYLSLGAVDVTTAGVLLNFSSVYFFFFFFLCVEEKSYSGRRDSNPGSRTFVT